MAEDQSLGTMAVRIVANATQFNMSINDVKKTLIKTQQDFQRLASSLTQLANGVFGKFGRQIVAEMRTMDTEFSASIDLVKAQFKDVEREIATALLPTVKEAVNWFTSLDKETQTLIVSVGSLSFAIGPLLNVMRSVLAITFSWVGALALLPVAFAVIADGLLQLTGQGNLGLLDFVNNFRIAGVRISTWMEVAALQVFKSWTWVTSSIRASFITTAFAVEQVWERALRGILSLAKEVTTTLASPGLKFLANLAGVDIRGLQFAANLGTSALDDQTSKSASRSLRATLDLNKDIGAEDARYAKEKAVFDDTIAKLFADEGVMFEERKVAPAAKAVETKAKEQKHKEERVGAPNREAEFQTFSLRRFVLDGPGGLARPTPKQAVEAVGVEQRLDKLIQVTENKSTTAKLG